jgi:hypothetical protein
VITVIVGFASGAGLAVALRSDEHPPKRARPTPSTLYQSPTIWDEAKEMKRCNTASLHDLAVGGDTGATWWDVITHQRVFIGGRDFCRQKVPLMPDPRSYLGVAFHVANGKLAAVYYINRGGALETPLPPAQAEALLAAQKAARAHHVASN